MRKLSRQHVLHHIKCTTGITHPDFCSVKQLLIQASTLPSVLWLFHQRKQTEAFQGIMALKTKTLQDNKHPAGINPVNLYVYREKKHTSFKKLSRDIFCSLSGQKSGFLYHPVLQLCVFKAPPPEYAVCSDWSARARLSQHYSPRLLSALMCSQRSVSFTSRTNISINYANLSKRSQNWRRDHWRGVSGAVLSVGEMSSRWCWPWPF